MLKVNGAADGDFKYICKNKSGASVHALKGLPKHICPIRANVAYNIQPARRKLKKN